ncbi:MAG: hypothetical protein FWC70_13290 [Defluviitaleaceae bacterium]|nr:hypothetical protein [Defluviitaleaceae bacterium]
MSNGYILLHRKIRDHWIWKNPVYFQWWVDLLFEARYTPGKLVIAGELHTIERGELRTSKLKLSQRWECNRKSVEKFLKLLERDGMIKTETDNFGTTLKVCNYAEYQDFTAHKGATEGVTDGTATGATPRTPRGTSEGTTAGATVGTQKNKRNKEIQETQETKPLPPAADEVEHAPEDSKAKKVRAELCAIRNSFSFAGKLNDAVNDWIKYKFEKRQPYNPTGLRNLLARIQNSAERHGDDAIACVIEDSMASNYTGIVWSKITPHVKTDSAPKNRFVNFKQRDIDYSRYEKLERAYIDQKLNT